MTSSPQNNGPETIELQNWEGNPLFPVFLKLNNLHTVLVGAGFVGLEKLTAIVQNSPGAKVTVIALAISDDVHILAQQYRGIKLIRKSFTDSDLNNANLVIAATNDSKLNQFIRQSAHDRKLLINVADKPELCDFYLGSIVQKGDLKIAISTNGKSPTVAKRLKEVLNEALPAELNTTLQQISALRNTLSGDFAFKVKRLNQITSVLVEKNANKRKSTWLVWSAVILSIIVIAVSLLFNEPGFKAYAIHIIAK